MILAINIIIEFSCLLAALYFLRKDRTPFSSFTIYYLTIVCCTEMFGFILIKNFHQSNAWLYNILILFEVSYITYGLYVALKPFTNKALLLARVTMLIFILTYLIELYYHGIFNFNTITISISSVIFVLMSLYYYYLLMKHHDIINLKYHTQFWWIGAVLFYYFGSTIYNLFTYILLKNTPHSYDILVYTMLGLNLILYSIWTYAYICRSRQRKLFGSS